MHAWSEAEHSQLSRGSLTSRADLDVQCRILALQPCLVLTAANLIPQQESMVFIYIFRQFASCFHHKVLQTDFQKYDFEKRQHILGPVSPRQPKGRVQGAHKGRSWNGGDYVPEASRARYPLIGCAVE